MISCFCKGIVNSPSSISFGIVIDVADSHSGKHIPKSPDFRFRFNIVSPVVCSPLSNSHNFTPKARSPSSNACNAVMFLFLTEKLLKYFTPKGN